MSRQPGFKSVPRFFVFILLLFIPFIAGAKAGFFIDAALSGRQAFPDKSGASLLWGLMLSAACAPFLAKLTKTEFKPASDIIAVSLSIALFFTRLGCLFNGCCIGKPAPETFIAPVYYPYGSYADTVSGSSAFYPYQLFESLIWLFIFFFLLILRRKKLLTGLHMLIIASIYLPLRFIAEFSRYNDGSFPLTTGQFVSAALFIAVILLLFRQLKTK